MIDELVATEDDVTRAIQEAVRSEALRTKIDVMMPILTGGIWACVLLSQHLKCDKAFRVEPVRVESYEDNVQKMDPVVTGGPYNIIGEGNTILIVDDITDTGKTFDAVIRALPQTNHFIRFALVARAPRGKYDVAAFEDIGPGFLYGCGMDDKGRNRALSSIWRKK